MRFVKEILFNEDIVFDSNRNSHKKMFKVDTKRYTRMNHRKGKRERVVDRTFVIFEKDLKIKLDDISVIVGENGCGKTSLVKMLYLPKFAPNIFSQKTKEEELRDYFKEYISNKRRTLKFDKYPSNFINGKSIHKNVFIENVKNSKQVLDPMDVLAMWHMEESSNGENTLDFIDSLKDINNSLIILDEPETSLSIRSQILVKKKLKKLAKNNQLIIITHSPVIMELADEVYDLEKKKHTHTKEYVDYLYS